MVFNYLDYGYIVSTLDGGAQRDKSLFAPHLASFRLTKAKMEKRIHSL